MLRRVRHAHHRRGPRAQPQHRLPARLPQAAAAPPARPQGHHHLGHDRPGAVLRATSTAPRSSRCPAGPTRSRSATGRWSDEPTRRGRATSRGAATRSRPSATRSTSCAPEGPGDILVFLVRRAGDPRHRRRAAPPRTCRHTEVLPLYARLSAAEQHRVFAAAPGPADRAGHQRGRDLADRARHPLRGRPGHGPHLPLQPAAQGAAAADRAGLAGLGQPARGPLRPDVATASASGSTPRRTSQPGRSSPNRRSCAPTSPR